MKIELIIWLIGFPLATTINRYFSDKIKIQRGEELTKKDIVETVNWIELAVFILVIIKNTN